MTETAQRLPWFDLWRAGYGSATVEVRKAGTSALAAVYKDINLTESADNPFTLESKTVGGIVYGKSATPLYVVEAVELVINSVDETGIVRPALVSFNDELVDNAIGGTRRGTVTRRLIDRFDDVIHVEDFGVLSTSDSTSNSSVITRALGAAAGQGGGTVLMPAGTWPITTLTLAADVVLQGEDRDSTVLRSQEGSIVCTISGDRAGLRDITLDGVNLTASSIGIAAEDINKTVMERVTIKRFETGIRWRGGSYQDWHDLSIDNCTEGANFLGDTLTGDDGDTFEHNVWRGGTISTCTTHGIQLKYENALVRNNRFENLHFDGNTGAAVRMRGARYTDFVNCHWEGNTTVFDVDDGSDTSLVDFNTIIGLFVHNGLIDGGAMNFQGLCQDIHFQRMRFGAVDWTLTAPENAITLTDVTEDTGVTVTGDELKLQRWRHGDRGEIVGVTTDATATDAWEVALNPGEVVYAEAKIIGRQRDGEERSIFHIGCGAIRDFADLSYDNQTSNFTVGGLLEGQTSGATARISADSDSGTTGTLSLRNIDGTFIDGETITDNSGGSADVNGSISNPSVALDTTGNVNIRAVYETDANTAAAFVASSNKLKLRVTGIASETWEWTVQVELMRP